MEKNLIESQPTNLSRGGTALKDTAGIASAKDPGMIVNGLSTVCQHEAENQNFHDFMYYFSKVLI